MTTVIFTSTIYKCNFSDFLRAIICALATMTVFNWKCPIMQAQVPVSVFRSQWVLLKLLGLLALLNGHALMQLVYGYDECSLLQVWWIDVRGLFPSVISSESNIMQSLRRIIFIAVKLKEYESHCANDIPSNMWGAGAMGEIQSWAEDFRGPAHSISSWKPPS